MANQKSISVSGGAGTGKTTCVAMGACWLALEVHPDFKFMNVAPTMLQAQWMYDIILRQAEGTPFERLIWSFPEKPYPKIEIKFKVYDTIVSSTLFFMSIDKNARNILTFEGDWINVDEAGLINNLEEVMMPLGTRLRGSFRGRERMGRLSLTSNPWDNPYFWYMFDMAQADPVNNLSIVVSTRHNHNVTEGQLAQMLSHIPKNEWAQFIDGGRPEGSGNYFSKESVFDCEDEEWGEEIMELADHGVRGFGYKKAIGVGVYTYWTPFDANASYILLGDPGIDSAPKRNAPTIGLWKVSNFPDERAELAYLWWGDGNGSIAPFVVKILEIMAEYKPVITAIDSTSTQKNMAETINALMVQRDSDGYSTIFGRKIKIPLGTKIKGLDFSGGKKASYLIATQFLLEARLLRWPKMAVGIRSQLTNYDPMLDKQGNGAGKIPQDLVSMISMSAYLIRRYFYVDPQNNKNSDEEAAKIDDSAVVRNLRYDREGRSLRNRGAYAIIHSNEKTSKINTKIGQPEEAAEVLT